MRAPYLVTVSAQRCLHRQGRIAGPYRMVLMGDRRPEQGHNAVAHDLVHGAFIAVHGLHHAFEHGVEELAGFFGITIGQQLQGAFEIGEEHGHLLALAFQGGFRRQDLLGEMRGGVCLGCLGSRCERWGGWRQ
jgi:hypothetical protein